MLLAAILAVTVAGLTFALYRAVKKISALEVECENLQQGQKALAKQLDIAARARLTDADVLDRMRNGQL
jgi:hypothetical protein